MIVKIFSPKNLAKIFAFFAQNKAKICKISIITLVFEKNANFFAENWQKSQKIVIINNIDPWSKSGWYIRKIRTRRGPFLTSPPGANFDPRDELVPQGRILSPGAGGEVIPWG
jgi:hypothetical protein